MSIVATSELQSANSKTLAASASNANDDVESIASDESEEMEVDEDEYERRRNMCMSDMKELESQFGKLKEALIFEKQILIDQKLKEIEDETADEFTGPIEKLKQNMDIKIKLASELQKNNHYSLIIYFWFFFMSFKTYFILNEMKFYDKIPSSLL